MSEAPFDVPLTRREFVVPPTQREGATTGTGLLMLPDSLRARWRIVGELAGGGEADVVLVEPIEGGERRVAKIYRGSITVDAQAAARLPDLDRTFLVAPLSTGFDNGRHWELMEYVPGGSLADLIAAGGVPARALDDVVRQLTEAVAELHRARITHSDLKPGNILVRGRAPLRLAVGDFGLSKYLADASKRFTRLGNTVAYAPPESFAGRFSPAQDWWALGMIVRELAGGGHPFAHLSDAVIMHELMVHDVPVDTVGDDRLRLLCRGLLVRDPDHRWDETQVRAWLAGESPRVHAGADVRAGRALVVAGRQCWTRAEAARAFAAAWDEAQQTFLTHIGTPAQPGEGWRLLRGWLEQFDEDVEQRARLIDQVLTARVAPEIRMVHLLRWLDPGLPPMYRGVLLHPRAFPAFAAAAATDPLGARIVDELWHHRLLELLAQFGGAGELAEIDRRWRNAVAQLASIADAAPPAARDALHRAAPDHRITLLQAAADPAVPSALSAQATAARARFQPRPPWFDRLARVQDPAVAVAVVTVAPLAETEHRRMLAAKDRPRQIWAAEEQRRADGRAGALGLATGGMAIWGAILFGGALVLLFADRMAGLSPFSPLAGTATGTQTAASPPPIVADTTIVTVFALAWMACFAAELGVAAHLGGHYHPRWSALTMLGRIWRRVPDTWDYARRAGNAMRAVASAAPVIATLCCCFACCQSGTLLAVLSSVLGLATLAGAAGHLVWSAVRFAQFGRLHRSRRKTLLGDERGTSA
jgi:hypothetical protein